ncbi:LysE family translocator [Arthrobacter sp. 35W]|uniref:LysE family translocator n=1 Tax=Arthrobacter sp. 35W TaxID=1132441 RepID=UPI0004215B9F|nr:LysE family translocator [Arthrobacter sp. 35W]
MEPHALAGFFLVAATLACTPGPDWAYSIAAGLGRRSFAPAIAGLCSGYLLHTVLLAFGIAALVATMPSVLVWLTVAGALYLLWLGFTTAKSWRSAGFSTGDAQSGGRLASYLRGLGTSSINPKGMLLFVALLPQFISPTAALPVPVQSGILGLVFVLTAGLIYSVVAVVSRRLLRSRPGAARGVTLASGIIMLGLGATLLAQQAAPVLAAVGR